MRILVSVIESLLARLGVKHLLVPAVKGLKRMWVHKFNMRQLTLQEAACVEDMIVSPDADSCVLLMKHPTAPVRGAGGSAVRKRPPSRAAAPAAKQQKRAPAAEVRQLQPVLK